MDESIERVRRFWAGEGRCVASLTPGVTFRPRQDLTGEEHLAAWRRGLAELACFPGLNVPSVFPDFGTISMPKYWGGRVVVSPDNGNPFIEPVAATLDEALALIPRPVDDPAMDAARAIRLFKQLGEPAQVHEFLDRVSNVLLAYWLRRESGDRICGNIWPFTFLPGDLGITLTEDLMPLLSVEMYAEFSISVLQKIGRAAGGLQVHCCGEWGRHVPTLAAADIQLRAVEFHHPFTKIEELTPLAKRTVFVPYVSLEKQTEFRSLTEYWRHLLATTDSRHRYWFAGCEDTAELREFFREVSG